jgi:putative FmdB family regulatory protein
LPLYEYQCAKCGHRFEKIESHSASTTKKCPKCGAKAKRLASAPAIQFKGSGWYVTDYAGKRAAAPSGEAAGDGAATKAPEKTAESKPATSSKSESTASKKKK